jgi:hypothetical protein
VIVGANVGFQIASADQHRGLYEPRGVLLVLRLRYIKNETPDSEGAEQVPLTWLVSLF